MAKTKKVSIEVSKDPALVKRMEEAAARLRGKDIKAVIFNHKNLVYDTRGLAVYNPISRTVVVLGSIRSSDFSIAPDVIVNTSRLEIIERISNLDNVLSDPDVYAVIDTKDFFNCVESKFNRKLEFDTDSADCTTIYYNEFSATNGYPKYLVREKVNQYKLCYSCHKLLLDELDHATINDDEYCYDCIVKDGREGYVDFKTLKLMQLHKLEADD